MANVMRYRGGDTRPQVFKTNPANPINEGDLLYKDSDGTVKPASAMGSTGTQATFAPLFAGVALWRSGLQPGEWTPTRTMDVGYVLVATSGDFEFDCPKQQWTPGQLVGVAVGASGPKNQQVDTTAASASAIGFAAPGVVSLKNPASSIVVRITSAIMG